jgi:hypothetical protein
MMPPAPDTPGNMPVPPGFARIAPGKDDIAPNRMMGLVYAGHGNIAEIRVEKMEFPYPSLLKNI